MNHLPQAPENNKRVISIFFFKNLHASQGAPPVSTIPVSLIPVANLPPVSTILAANLPPVSTTPAANNEINIRLRIP